MSLHFIRPWSLLACIPLFILMLHLWRQNTRLPAWSAICDEHLLAALTNNKGESRRHFSLGLLGISGLFMIIALSGPSWIKLPTPVYKQIQPRVVVLDMTETMLDTQLQPDRLTRAKFVLHDLFNKAITGQLALVAYTGEPFVVSPLTDDGKTIDALLPMLSVDIMPTGGNNLQNALKESESLIKQAGYQQGQILVLTATPPDANAIREAKQLAKLQIETSVMPLVPNEALNTLYQPLANAGNGAVLSLANTQSEIQHWLNRISPQSHFQPKYQQDFPQWRDEGRWFLLPAMLLLLPVFRRNWLQRMEV